MGQYYTPMIIDDANNIIGHVDAHEYQNGLKLMEHSYISNIVVERIEAVITENPQRVLWAGDYADDEPGERFNMYGKTEKNSRTKLAFLFNIPSVDKIRYLLNWDNHFAVVIPAVTDALQIHPLPLLTCEGNGRGGGDFRGENDHVGTWARNLVSISDELPAEFTLEDITFEES